MSKRFLIAILPLLLVCLTATAQEEAEKGDLVEIMNMKVMPSDYEAFEANIKDLVKAANMANLDAKYGWWTYSDFYNYAIVSPIANMAMYDDEDAWMTAFMGTEGEELVKQVMGKFGTEMSVSMTEKVLMEGVPAWTRWVDGAPDTGGVTVYQLRLQPEKYDAFNELVPEFVAAWQKMDYPYSILGNKPKFGEIGGLVEFAIFWDNKAKFYGENSIMAVAKRTGNGESYSALLTKLRGMLDSMDTNDWMYHPDLSYEGNAQVASQE